MKKTRSSNFARMLLLLATAMWGMSFPIIKAIRSDFYCENSSEISKSASYVFLRFGIVFLIYFLWVFVWKKEGKLSRQEFLVGSVIGVMGGVGMLLQGDSLAYTDPGTCAFITQMGCIWVPLVAFLRGRRAITPFFTFALLCGFLGLFLLSGFDPSRFTLGRGEMETLLASLFFSVQIITLESRRWRDYINLKSTCLMFFYFTAGTFLCLSC